MSTKCDLLLLASNAVDTLDPRAADEISGIYGAIQSAKYRHLIEPILHPAITVSGMRKLLLSSEANILHLSGHARLDEGLVIEENGRVASLNCAELVRLILLSNDDALRLVFFSFCHSEAYAASIAKKIPYAIGVRGEIASDSMLLFCQAFYEALASDRSVGHAFEIAREVLKQRGLAGANNLILKGGRKAGAKLPFLSAECGKPDASKAESVLNGLAEKFVSQLGIAGYVIDEQNVRRALHLDEGLYVHRRRAEASVKEFIDKATAHTPSRGKWLDIVGDAGHGKSSLLWHLFIEWQANPGFTVIPFLAQTENDLTAAVTTVTQIGEMRKQNRLIVLIDTLDLLVSDQDHLLAKALGELMALGALVITTSRKQEADQLGRLLSSNSRVELQRFDDLEAQQAIRSQIRIRFPRQSKPQREEQFKKVWGLLEQQRNIRELDLEPLILRLLFEAYGTEPIPQDVNTQQIYRHYWHKVVLFDRVVKTSDARMARERLCRYIAHQVAFGETHSDKFLTGALNETAGGYGSAAQTLEGLVSSGVMQWADGRSSVRFFHQTLLEFTAAYDLLLLDETSLSRFVTQLFVDVAGFKFFRAPILKQLAIQSFDPNSNSELHLQLMSGLREVNNELAAQLALEILGKVPVSEGTHDLVRQWINAAPQTFIGVICETVRHYPQRKTELALELLEPFIASSKETAIYAICADTFSPGEPEIVQRFLRRQLSRVMEANDDIKTYFEHALFAAARFGAVKAIDDLLALLPAVKAGQQAAILDGIAAALNAKTALQGEHIVKVVIDLLPKIPGKQRNEVWEALCRLTGKLNRVSPTIGSRLANWLAVGDIWRRDTGAALYIGKIVGQIMADTAAVEQTIDKLRSRDHLLRMFNTGLLANAPAELSPNIMRRIHELDHQLFSDIDTIRALFTVVSSLSGISADQILAFLSRWTWPTSGIGTALNVIVERLAATDPHAARDWLLTQLKEPQAFNVKVVRALALLIQKKPKVFDSAQLHEVYEKSFAVTQDRQAEHRCKESLMPYLYACPRCSNNVPPTMANCPHCDRQLPPPNVRAAEASSEVAALYRRYQKGTQDAKKRGAESRLSDFESTIDRSQAVIARPLGDVMALTGSENQVYATFYELARSEIRLPTGGLWDRRRREADAALFSGYEEQIRFAALTLNGLGLSNYGSCSVVLRSSLIEDRSSALEVNSVLFAERHRSRQGRSKRVPPGYRSTWAGRAKLSIAKLFHCIDAATEPEEYAEILLRQSATTADDEFVEIQIWGSVTVRTIEEVTLETRKIKAEGISVRSIESKLKKFGVKVKRWTR